MDADKSNSITNLQSRNPSQDSESQETTEVKQYEDSRPSNSDSLIKEEKELRQALRERDKNSEEYAELYKKWFAAREKGVEMGVFQFFVPSPTE